MFQSTPLREGRLARMRGECWISTVSIHAPARGATISLYLIQASQRSVSIHAPARGATRRMCNALPRVNSFNPRPCARGDAPSQTYHPLEFVSIHAPARGATPLTPTSRAHRMFQSTPLREGRQKRASTRIKEVLQFQSTPLREGRP